MDNRDSTWHIHCSACPLTPATPPSPLNIQYNDPPHLQQHQTWCFPRVKDFTPPFQHLRPAHSRVGIKECLLASRSSSFTPSLPPTLLGRAFKFLSLGQNRYKLSLEDVTQREARNGVVGGLCRACVFSVRSFGWFSEPTRRCLA
jgi:hypothetical protein